jgi:predicted lipoprotein with Yx(FWY)xxD motif
MKKLLIGAVAVMGVAAACGGTSTGGSGGPGAGANGGSSTADVLTGSTSMGTVLTNKQGFTLYYFTPEQGGTVACTGACATIWPPLTVTGSPTAASGITGTLGTVANGGMEVTYNGWPLHTYSGDSAAGQTNGQGIMGQWFAATPGLTSSGGGSSTSSSGATTPNYGGGY